jgi:hypothetical protein
VPGCYGSLRTERANAINLAQSIRLDFDDVDHLLGLGRANTAGHAVWEKSPDPVDGTGRGGAHERAFYWCAVQPQETLL